MPPCQPILWREASEKCDENGWCAGCWICSKAESRRESADKRRFQEAVPTPNRSTPSRTLTAPNRSTPPLRGNPPPLRQRRYAIKPGVTPSPALPRVQAQTSSLPRTGLCRRACWGVRQTSIRAPKTPHGKFIARRRRAAESPNSLSQRLCLSARGLVPIPTFRPVYKMAHPPPNRSTPSRTRTAPNRSTPPLQGNPPPLRQRRCALQPGVTPSAALPRVWGRRSHQPQSGCAVRARRGGAGNKGGMKSCSRVRKRSPPGISFPSPCNTHTSHTTHSNHRHNPVGVVDMLCIYPG